jgi:hypothetical protein
MPGDYLRISTQLECQLGAGALQIRSNQSLDRIENWTMKIAIPSGWRIVMDIGHKNIPQPGLRWVEAGFLSRPR